MAQLADVTNGYTQTSKDVALYLQQISDVTSKCTDIVGEQVDITTIAICARYMGNQADNYKNFLLDNRNLTDIILYGNN